jgi:DNA processing protein
MAVVIAGGLLHPSPAGNTDGFRKLVASGGVVVSDRSPTRTPHRRDFVRRNSLIAALADAVVVAAAPERSGALETARVARKLGVPVLAVPGMFDDPTFAGCHQLIRDGASVCTRPSDVTDALGIQPVLQLERPNPGPPLALSSAARQLLKCLERGLGMDEVVRGGLSAADAQVAFLELELAGLAPR